MAPRKCPDPPVDIVLTEEDLEAIIRESLGRALPGRGSFAADPPAGPSTMLSAAPPPADGAWSLGVRSPGAVGDAIRMILEATTLERGKRMKVPGSGE